MSYLRLARHIEMPYTSVSTIPMVLIAAVRVQLLSPSLPSIHVITVQTSTAGTILTADIVLVQREMEFRHMSLR